MLICIGSSALWLTWFAAVNAATGDRGRAICYYNARSNHPTSTEGLCDTPTNLCTSEIYLYSDRNVESASLASNNRYDEIVAHVRAKITDSNTMESIAGETQDLGNYFTVVDTATQRQTFTSNVVTSLLTHGLDGLDIDLAYPDEDEEVKSERCVLLLNELSQDFDEHGLTLNVTWHIFEKSQE